MATPKTTKQSAPRKKKTQKTATRPAVNGTSPAKPRQLRMPQHNSLRLRTRLKLKHPVRVPSVWQLTKKTCVTLWKNRLLFACIALIYVVLELLTVTGLSGGADISSLKQQFTRSVPGGASQLSVGLSVFTDLLTFSSANSSNSSAGVYEICFVLLISLATIWALRQVIAGEPTRLRDAFYKGMYPLVPFILVLAVILLQTLPFLIGGGLFSTVITNGIAVSLIEQIVWGLLFLALALVSVYMWCSSLFALYIVTLPDMTPMKALRSARQLVQHRRPAVFRKLLFLPIALLVVAAVIMIPIIIVAAPIAAWAFLLLTICALIVAHAYMYTLYRELLV